MKLISSLQQMVNIHTSYINQLLLIISRQIHKVSSYSQTSTDKLLKLIQTFRHFLDLILCNIINPSIISEVTSHIQRNYVIMFFISDLSKFLALRA